MDAVLNEWASLLVRWVHVIAGIAWIGSSFYFMHLDAALRETPDIPKGKGGEAWEVHGGGFYQVRKFLIAPAALPAELIWHKWQAYSTWISGFFLLVWIYYANADLYLIDPAVRDIGPGAAAAIGIGALGLGWIVYDRLCHSPLARNEVHLSAVVFAFIVAAAWLFQQVFSGRGALMHVGALMATIMTGNVFLNIIPNQKKVVAALIAGKEPDPEFGRQAKARSRHNNYLTLPVLFLMMSGHYPLTFASPYAWVMVGFVLVAGASVRHFYNERHAGRGDKWWSWGLAAACVAAAVLLSALPARFQRDADSAATPVHVPEAVAEIITGRCAMCHAAEPAWLGFATAPKGVVLDSPRTIAQQADAIRVHAVLTNAMPPNNVTSMTVEERRSLAAWLQSR
ncbi:MAG: cysteine desulfurase [Alphaproteobacteria bacterium]|nr:cysteine desulfurase [Alphaproteobacteria bacterium]